MIMKKILDPRGVFSVVLKVSFNFYRSSLFTADLFLSRFDRVSHHVEFVGCVSSGPNLVRWGQLHHISLSYCLNTLRNLKANIHDS